jgi:predicted lipoprotein with Yx(FWY)xxD motif
MMRRLSVFLALCMCVLALLTAACSATPGNGAQGNNHANSTAIPPYAASNGPRAESTVIVVGNTGLPIRVARLTVNGKPIMALTNNRGMTLYYDDDDTPTSVCTDSCAWDWPPLLSPTGAPTSAQPLPGKLGILVDTNGRQVTYNGHPLYLFAVDSGPYQTTGEGEEGDWHVATTTLSCKYRSLCS